MELGSCILWNEEEDGSVAELDRIDRRLSNLSLRAPLHHRDAGLPLNESLASNLFARMDKATFITARLVCSTFHASSIPHITSLSFDSTQASAMHRNLADRLHVFSFVDHLDLCISLPHDISILDAPVVLARLCKLRLVPNQWKLTLPGPDTWEVIASRLAAATRLTALELDTEMLVRLKSGSHLKRLLGACPVLAELTLTGLMCTGHDSKIASAVLQVTTLRTLRSLRQNWKFWRVVNGNALALTRLQSLECVPVTTDNDVKHLELGP
eukprot:jgi/Botrbrau1/12724/Bobra.67_1s0086.3